jgi:ribosomal protein S18 acetylase RimI-like enzyme
MTDAGRAFLAPAHPLRREGLLLRPIRDEDLGFLSEIYALTRAAEMALVTWPEAAKRAFLQQQFDAQHAYYRLNYPGADFLLVQLQGVPVGRIYVYRSPGDIRLMDIALLPDVRRRGIASELLAELIEESERSNCTITLHVEADNPAMHLYQRLGFVHLEDRGVYQYLGRTPTSRAVVTV